MRLFLPFFLLIYLSFKGHAQNGYLGKLNVISVEAFANSPLILSNKMKQYAFENEKMVEKKERINYGYGIYFAHQVKKKLGIGLELNVKNILIQGPSSFSFSNTVGQLKYIDTVWLRAAPYSVNVFSPTFRLELYNKLGNGPVGIAHVLGIGISLSKSVDKAYYYSLNEFGDTPDVEANWTKPDKFFLDKEWPLITSIALQYGVQMRYPISHNLSINFGIKSLFNLALPINKAKLDTRDNAPYFFNDLYYNLRKENVFSLNLNAGISYHF